MCGKFLGANVLKRYKPENLHVSLFGTVLSISDNIMHYQRLISVFLKNTSRDQLLQKAYYYLPYEDLIARSRALHRALSFRRSSLSPFFPSFSPPYYPGVYRLFFSFFILYPIRFRTTYLSHTCRLPVFLLHHYTTRFSSGLSRQNLFIYST